MLASSLFRGYPYGLFQFMFTPSGLCEPPSPRSKTTIPIYPIDTPIFPVGIAPVAKQHDRLLLPRLYFYES